MSPCVQLFFRLACRAPKFVSTEVQPRGHAKQSGGQPHNSDLSVLVQGIDYDRRDEKRCLRGTCAQACVLALVRCLTMCAHIRCNESNSAGLLLHSYETCIVISNFQAVSSAPFVLNGTVLAATGSVAVEAEETIVNIPKSLSSNEDSQPRKNLSKYFEGPQRRQIQQCTKICVTTCTRGGAGVNLVHVLTSASNAKHCALRQFHLIAVSSLVWIYPCMTTLR